LPLLTLHNAV